MSTLVTGGTGFLGARLAKRLRAEGREVKVLARRPSPELSGLGIRVVTTSLDDAAAVQAACAGVETVFHVAAKVGVWGRYAEFFQTNVLGTRSLLSGCREHGVKYFVHTSTPSVVYSGKDLSGADESLPLTTHCPSPYPLTKAIAEAEVLAANGGELRTIALRPHLIWGAGDPHLVPRILYRARAGRLRIVGSGTNRVDMVHVENAVDAHLQAEATLRAGRGAGRAYFITNDEPVLLWDWINDLLAALGEPRITKRVSLNAAKAAGGFCELFWRLSNRKDEPPMTRFIAAELAKDHWFNIAAAKNDLEYAPRISMAEGTRRLIESLHR